MRIGLAYMDKKHHEQAVKTFTEVIELDPTFVGGWTQRAMALLSLRRFELAIQDCAKALELKPHHFGTLATLGMCHKGRGDSRSAVRYFKECLEVHPGLLAVKSVIGSLELEVTKKEISKHLWPRIVHIVQGLHDGSLSAEDSGPDWLTCDWDMFHVLKKPDDKETGLEYIFRVRVENRAPSGQPAALVGIPAEPDTRVRSIARFYVLRFAGGDVFPLTRINNGPRIFQLGPGESHRFSFRLRVGDRLRDAVGGVLLERSTPAEGAPRHLAERTLALAAPGEATHDEAERLRLGYNDIGELDIRKYKFRNAQRNKP